MKRRVELTIDAHRDIEHAYQWIAERSDESAVRWVGGLQRAIDSLGTDAERCAVLPDSQTLFGVEVRQLLYGKRAHKYRILFAIRPECVQVIRVRHAAQDEINL